ncbi:hypothetical protein ACIREE_39595 [Streptomyces sp. NPDC102467]|uniref:hypothetical protein n=1 Tax=Streptomyces sp. NPDC102467 TaxID=3366179 RepID=UPI00381E98C6
MTDDTSVSDALATIDSAEGRLDVLVNNAGVLGNGMPDGPRPCRPSPPTQWVWCASRRRLCPLTAAFGIGRARAHLTVDTVVAGPATLCAVRRRSGHHRPCALRAGAIQMTSGAAEHRQQREASDGGTPRSRPRRHARRAGGRRDVRTGGLGRAVRGTGTVLERRGQPATGRRRR